MKKILGIVVLGLMLSGCATNFATINADSQLSNDSINFNIPKNTSRIYFLTGSCDAPLKKWDCEGAGGIFINSQYIGSLNKKDVMVVDIKPGKHEILWNYNKDYKLKSFGTKNIPANIKLDPGEFLIVRLSINVGTRRGGLLGAALKPDRYEVEYTDNKYLVINKNVVVPLISLPK